MLIHHPRCKAPTPPRNAQTQAVRPKTPRQERSSQRSPDHPEPPTSPTTKEERGEERGAGAAAPHKQPQPPQPTTSTPDTSPVAPSSERRRARGSTGHRRLVITGIGAPLLQPCHTGGLTVPPAVSPPVPFLPFRPRGEHGAAPRSPEASVPGPGARLGPTGPPQGPHGEPPGRADTGTAPPGLPAPFPPHHRGAPGPGPAAGRAEIEAWRPRYRGLSPEQGPGPTGAANSAPGPDRGSTGERGEPTGGQGSPFPRFPEVPKPPRPRRAPPGHHSPQRRGRPARRPRPPPLTDFKRGSAVRTSQSAPAARPRRALIGRSASRLQEDPDVPARRAGGDGKCRAQTHRAVCGEPEANYNSHNAQGDGA